VAALAGTVQGVAAGAGLMWALDREGTLPDRTRLQLRTVLAPYLPGPHRPGEQVEA
jgi:hypothetical protein